MKNMVKKRGFKKWHCDKEITKFSRIFRINGRYENICRVLVLVQHFFLDHIK